LGRKSVWSVVVREKWSDWSLFSVSTSDDAVEVTVTIEMERLANALMIYNILGAERELIRKVP
jgi:regulation of enolase protein 1 (concanavalin A-like superfamily)